uniref:cytochrome c oxidase subunit II n=1 Tax=Pachycondyla annamita TaxID=613577 RepID=UPI002551CCD4|nr:cytochrome c oxidase subunit II [Pachycondyla annamita]WGF22855.1 cytochrome c oxidase subunit 2 [Pachycondyla annamita]
MNTWLLSLQNSNSPIYDMMIFFHDFTMMIIIFITLMIFYILVSIMFNKLINRNLLNGHLIELIWTIIPMFILIFIAMPSIKILYLTDEINSTNLTVKTIGHQWYWSYEYTNFFNINFDSYMIQLSDLKINEFRLLDVDNRCVLPFNYPIRILTTSLDVIHAWTIPSLGIKMDSTPGRLNQSMLFMYRPGLFYGQCSEICGLNHSFMPIVIESTNFKNFFYWIKVFIS